MAPNMQTEKIKSYNCERLCSLDVTMSMGLSSTRLYEENGNKLGRKGAQPWLFWPFLGRRWVKELHSREVASEEVIRKNYSRKEATREAKEAMQVKSSHLSKSYGLGTLSFVQNLGTNSFKGDGK